MYKFKKALPLFIIYFLAALVPMAIGAVVLWRQGGTAPAVVKATTGRPGFVSAAFYGASPQEAETIAAAAASGGLYGENTAVQNLQPPSISGFSSGLFTGNSTINYSLDLPPGRGGLTPSVSLIYSSASVYDQVIGADFDDDGGHDNDDVTKWKENLYVQSSQVGLGWQVGGLGQIFRDAQGRYTLILNGQSYRLFKKDDGSWRTEPESFLKISHQVIANEEPGDEGSPADKFVIYDTNGTYYEFTPRGFFWKRCDYRGEENRCRQMTEQWCRDHYTGDWWKQCEKWAASWNKWVLNRVRDVHGNEVDIPYAEERRDIRAGGNLNSTYPRAIYPYEINYSGAFDPAGLDVGFKSKIEFQFADRGDDENLQRKEVAWLHLYYSEKRIAKINIKVRQADGSWKIVRQYDLDNDQYFTGKDNENLHPKLLGITARGRDDNNDGVGDQVLPTQAFTYYEDANNLHTFRLLSTADNGYGGQVAYQYQMYTTLDYDPTTGTHLGWVSELHRVTEKTAFDGRGNSFKTTYGYEGPLGIADDYKHSGFESLGHSWVVETVFAKNSASNKIRDTKYYFIQGKFDDNRFYAWPERGRVKKTEVYDGSGALLSFSKTDYLREPADDGAAQSAIWETSHFVAAKESRSCQDPNSQWPQGSKTTYHYRPGDQNGQQWGNLTQQTEYKVTDCNFGGATAYRMTHKTYFPNPTSHITNRVGGTQTLACNTDLAGTTANFVDCPTPQRLSLVWNFYDNAERPWNTPGSKGELTSARVWYEFPEVVNVGEFQNGNWRTVDAQSGYDQFGNLTTASSFSDYGRVSASNGQWTFLPVGGGSAARTSTTAYEGTYHTFPVSVTNPLGHQTRTGYWSDETEVGHPYLANKIFSWDANNQQSTAVVDGLGRTVSSFLPGEGVASVKIDYRDADPFFVHIQTRDDKDDGGAVTYYHSWQFYNGLGQLIESQSEVEGDGQKIALTATIYNALGQAEKTLLPYDPGTSGGSLITPDFDNKPYTQALYDSLGRVTESWAPAKTTGQWYKTKTGYYGRKTAVLDANNHLKVSESDNLGRLIEVQEFENERSLGVPTDYYAKVHFDYDHLDRLLTTTDTLGNTTTISYNQFGQKESSNDPDLGRWSYTYYPMGTLRTITDAKSQVTTFRYDILDRTIYKYYGDTSTVPVTTFTYDSCQNGKGRLCSDLANEAATLTTYSYDQKGRLTSERKIITERAYTTQFAYDAAGRQREITYPDPAREKVVYNYNEAGLLKNVAGAQTYLASVDYNILGLPKEEVLGNQTKNVYTYEPQTYRLDTKTVKDKNGADLWSQNLDYDPVGNISPITYPLEDLTINYSYDDLNRLMGMTSSLEGFSADYDYDQLGRMTLKSEAAPTPTPTPTPTPGPPTPPPPEPPEFTIPLSEGWNLISLLLEPADKTIEIITEPIVDPMTEVWYWDGDVEGWYLYVPDWSDETYSRVGIPKLLMMEPGKGYFIRVNEDTELPLWGAPFIYPAIGLKADHWYMVGALAHPALILDLLGTCAPDTTLLVYWDGEAEEYREVPRHTSLAPRRGYFIQSLTDCTFGGEEVSAIPSALSKLLGKLFSFLTGAVGEAKAQGPPPLPLVVILNAIPDSVAPLADVDLKASVFGAGGGTIDYKFDCEDDGTWDLEIAGEENPYTAEDLCHYPSLGTYTARVEMVEGVRSAEGTTTITVAAGGEEVPLHPGWNRIVFPGETPSSAAEAVETISRDCGQEATYAISRYKQGFWESFVSDYGGANFTLSEGRVVYIRTASGCIRRP